MNSDLLLTLIQEHDSDSYKPFLLLPPQNQQKKAGQNHAFLRIVGYLELPRNIV
jgi:hypothetical protein